MAIVDNASLPVSVSVHSARPHESRLVDAVVENCHTKEMRERLIGDRPYDSDVLKADLAQRGVEMIAPHCKNGRPENKTQNGRMLRRYKRRWKVARLFAWLQSFGRIRTRDEFYAANYEGKAYLGYIVLLLRECSLFSLL